MNDNLECPECGSIDLDDGSFDFNGMVGVETHTPPGGHYSCMECDWDGTDVNESGDYYAIEEDKADGEREERMLDDYEKELNFDE